MPAAVKDAAEAVEALAYGDPRAAESDVRGQPEMFPVKKRVGGVDVPQVFFRGDQIGVFLRA